MTKMSCFKLSIKNYYILRYTGEHMMVKKKWNIITMGRKSFLFIAVPLKAYLVNIDLL